MPNGPVSQSRRTFREHRCCLCFLILCRSLSGLQRVPSQRRWRGVRAWLTTKDGYRQGIN